MHATTPRWVRHFVQPWASDAWPIRATTDLLSRPLVFGQQGLLRPKQFVKAAKERGLSFEVGQLEQLHRRGLVVPLFEIRSRAHRALPRIETSPDDMPVFDSDVIALYHSAFEGRLADPAAHRFRSWPTNDELSPYLYSHYQLIELNELHRIVTLAVQYRDDDGNRAWQLEPIAPETRRAAERGRRLAIALEVLDARYRPSITNVLRGASPETWSEHHYHRSAREEFGFLEVAPEVLVDQAEALLFRVHSWDPLTGWLDVIRHASARAWSKLRGDARLAIDYRIAAEVLLRFREEIVLLGLAEALPRPESRIWHPLDDRLKVESGSLDKALLDFGLSPHPALVVAVEGPTETYLLPKVLDYTGIDEQSGWIEVVDMQGGNSDAKALARHVVHPRLGEARGDYAMLRRPLTALAIVVDPGTKYSKPGARELIVRKAFEALPPVRRTEKMRKLLDDLVSVHTWDPELGPFEFAHFTDGELTDAVVSAAPRGLRTDESTLRKEIATERAAVQSNLRIVLERNAPGLSKPALAERLWPVLELRIQEALVNDDEASHPPISRIARSLYGISFVARRANAVEL